jgi:CubicO group peptidase (beta-lactamase class C family)
MNLHALQELIADLADSAATAQVTLLQLLNHTTGWEGDFFPDTGDRDFAGSCREDTSKACQDPLMVQVSGGVAEVNRALPGHLGWYCVPGVYNDI